MLTAATVALVALALPAQGDKASPITVNSNKLKAKLEEIRKANGLPAMAACVIKNDQLIAVAWTGNRKLGGASPVTGLDIWQLGSITKIFTKELVRQRVIDGKFKWEDTLATVFPEYKDTLNANVKALTVKQVADHVAGLANSYEGNAAMFIPNQPMAITRLKHVQEGLKLSPPWPKGKDQYSYSNFGYCLLGYLGGRYQIDWETSVAIMLNGYGVTNAFYGEPGLKWPNTQPWPHTSTDSAVTPVGSIKNTLPYNTYAPAGHLSVNMVDAPKLLMGYMKAGGFNIGGFDGSNGRNYARTSISTSTGWALLICTNVGGPKGKAGVDAATTYINSTFK